VSGGRAKTPNRACTWQRPGDVLGSGTLTGGCLLELGPLELTAGAEPRWIEPGDLVALEAEGLGRLETPVR
jgi:fumarylacetoacetate (FAA) hydrolase